MTKKEFSAIINYIKNRPEEAARLREVLGFSTDTPSVAASNVTWVSASELGELIGKSSTVVRRKLTGTVFNHFTRMGAKNAYRYDKEASLMEWDAYHKRLWDVAVGIQCRRYGR